MSISKYLPKQGRNGQYIITSLGYRKQVEIAQKVNELSDDVTDKDQKKKFLMRGYPPTVEQLSQHHVFENFVKFFPYLLYYHESDLHIFPPEDSDFYATREYISSLFKGILRVEEAERKKSPMLISVDEYDDMVEHNREKCGQSLRHLTKYERDALCGRAFPTLERIQSLDVRQNFERLLPFLIMYREPQLMKIEKENVEGMAIRKYLRDVFYDCLEFTDD